jgi:hypothetical protein
MIPRKPDHFSLELWDRMNDEEKKYSCLMGMSEMEEAIREMEEKAMTLNISFSDVRMRPDEFQYDNGKLVGFCQLLAREMMVPDYPNNEFIPSEALIKRLNERWGTDYPKPRTYLERMQEVWAMMDMEVKSDVIVEKNEKETL